MFENPHITLCFVKLSQGSGKDMKGMVIKGDQHEANWALSSFADVSQ